MPQRTDSTLASAQDVKRQKRRAAFARANERAKSIPGVFAFDLLVKELYDPQTGVSVKRPGVDRNWFASANGFPTASRLRRHVEQKESLAVTWGPKATIRVIDADAHGLSNPLAALPVLWQAIQALHFGREVLLPELVNGRIPDGVRLDGAIITSPNGLHYIERTVKPDDGDCLRDDVARVTACLRQYDATVRPGRLEVLPSSNGQSRLPLGPGCKFVYPDVGAVDFDAGVALLSSLELVKRDFPDVAKAQPERVVTSYEGREVYVEYEASAVEPEPYRPSSEEYAEYLSWEQTRYTIAPSSPKFLDAKKAHRVARRSTTTAQPLSAELSGKSEWVEQQELTLLNGATAGARNREFWELCFLLRLTRGYTREETERRVTEWIDTANHTSEDLCKLTHAKRRAAIRLLKGHLDRLDRGLASGRFYQVGDGKGSSSRSSKTGEALLLNPATPEQIERFRAVGLVFLQSPDGASLLRDYPVWIQKSLPVLVGGISHWSRDGKIAIPTATVAEYAKTKKSKEDPSSGMMKPAYKILIDLLQQFGVISGIMSKARNGARLAAVYETNVVQHERSVRSEKGSSKTASSSEPRLLGERLQMADARTVEAGRTRGECEPHIVDAQTCAGDAVSAGKLERAEDSDVQASQGSDVVGARGFPIQSRAA
jgi:hypothetical protein